MPGAAGGSVAIVIVGLLAIPGVGGFGFVILRDHEGVFPGGIVVRKIVVRNIVFRNINGRAVLLGNLKLSGRRGRAQFAFEYGHRCLAGAVEFHAKMRGLGHGDGLVGKIQLELVARFIARLFRVKIRVDGAGDKLHGAELLAIVAERKTSEVHFAVGRKTQRAAIFEFHFRAAIFARLQLRALNHGQVDKRLIKTVAGGAIDLHRALHFAQADDARLRLGRRRDHQKRRCEHGPHCQHLSESCDRHILLLGLLP